MIAVRGKSGHKLDRGDVNISYPRGESTQSVQGADEYKMDRGKVNTSWIGGR